jgi:hypothetical protein
MVASYGIAAALRGLCFSLLNNRMTRRLRCEGLLARRTSSPTRYVVRCHGRSLSTRRLQADWACRGMTVWEEAVSLRAHSRQQR